MINFIIFLRLYLTIINMYINRLALLHVILILIGLCNQQFNILEFLSLLCSLKFQLCL